MAFSSSRIPLAGYNNLKPPMWARLNRQHWSAQGLCLLYTFNEVNEFNVDVPYGHVAEQIGYRSMDLAFPLLNSGSRWSWSGANHRSYFRGTAAIDFFQFANGVTGLHQPKFDFRQGFTVEYVVGVVSEASRPVVAFGTAPNDLAFSVLSGAATVTFQLSANGTALTSCNIASYSGNHFFATWDPTTAIMRYYGDNVVRATAAFAGPIFNPIGTEWVIGGGSFWGGGTTDTNHELAKIAVYNRSLSSEEINYLTLVDPYPMFSRPDYYGQTVVVPPQPPYPPPTTSPPAEEEGDVELASYGCVDII